MEQWRGARVVKGTEKRQEWGMSRLTGQRFVQLTHNWQMTIGSGVIASLPGLSPKQILTGWLKGRQRGEGEKGAVRLSDRQQLLPGCC